MLRKIKRERFCQCSYSVLCMSVDSIDTLIYIFYDFNSVLLVLSLSEKSISILLLSSWTWLFILVLQYCFTYLRHTAKHSKWILFGLNLLVEFWYSIEFVHKLKILGNIFLKDFYKKIPFLFHKGNLINKSSSLASYGKLAWFLSEALVK